MTTSSTPKSTPSRTLLNTLGTLTRQVLVVLIALIITLYAAIWLLSPWVIKQQLETPLSELGYQLGDTSHFRFNPFTFALSIEEFELLKSEANENQTNPVLTIQEAHLDIDTLGVFSKHIVIDRFELNGTHLQLLRNADMLSVAGYDLSSDTETSSATEDEPELNTDDNPLKDWLLVLHTFSIKDFNTHVSNELDLSTYKISNNVSNNASNNASQNASEAEIKQHLLTLKALTLNDVELGLRDQIGAINLSAALNQSSLTGKVTFDLSEQNGHIDLDLNIDGFSPSQFNYMLPPEVQNLTGTLSLATNQQLRLTNNDLSLSINTLSLDAKKLGARAAGLKHQITHSTFTLNDSQISFGEDGLSTIDLKPELTLKGVEISDPDNQGEVLQLKRLATQNLSVQQDVGTTLAASLDLLKLDGLVVSKPEHQSALFDGQGLSIHGISLELPTKESAGRSEIDAIEFMPFSSQILIAANGELGNLVPPKSQQDLAQEPQARIQEQPESEPLSGEQDAATDHKEPSFTFALNRFYLSGTSRIEFDDQSVSPNFSDTFRVTKLELTDLDSAQPSAFSPFAVDFSSGEYTQGELTGQTKPFTEKVNLELVATLKEFSLPKVSPYVRGPAGFDLLAGQFDLNADIKIVDDEIDGDTALALRGIELESAKDVKDGDLTEHTFIPLNLALGALKDSDGNIEMDVGLSGNIHDPNVGFDGFIYLITQKAVLSAAESYAINTFVPYANIVSLARTAGSFALKVRIDDMLFQTQQIQNYDAGQQTFINNLVALYQEKPDLQIKLCAISTFEELKDEDKTKSDEDKTQVLVALAESRSQALKTTLVKTHKVESSRVLLCKGRVDGSEEAQPRIEFNI